MSDCEQKTFYSPGVNVGRAVPVSSCDTPEVKIPEELKTQPKSTLDFIPELVPDNIILYSEAITQQCTEEGSYGDIVYVPQGYSTATYQILTLENISQDVIHYIIKNNIIPWLTNYINNEIAITSDSFDTHLNSHIKTVADKSNLTRKQAKQLLLESRDIIIQLNIVATQFAESQLLCYWLNKAQFADCPAPEEGKPATLEYLKQEADPNWHPVIIPAGQVRSYVSQDDANQQALNIALETLTCTYGNQEITVSCEIDKNMPGVETDSSPVYPGLKPRLSSVTIPANTFTSVTSISAADDAAREYALSLLVCYYVNKRTTGKCNDPTAGTLIKHTDSEGKNTYSIEYTIANPVTNTKGQYIDIPTGFITSDISQDGADFQAKQLAESLITCCFINQETEIHCPEQLLTDSRGNAILDTNGNKQYIKADPERSNPAAKRVTAGEFYSCTSQADADAQAAAFIANELNCLYCNLTITPACTPEWVQKAATTGVIVPKTFQAPVKIELQSGDIFNPGDEVSEGTLYQLKLPLELSTLVNPFTGQLEDYALWSEDATIGQPAGRYCATTILQAQQEAEIQGALLADTAKRKEDDLCRYFNLKTIVSCSGGDPWDMCPTCGRSHPVDIHEAPSPAKKERGSVNQIKQNVFWTEGIDLDTGEAFIFGNAKANAPFDEDLSYPNCASYLTIAAGVFVSYNSAEEATAAAMASALSALQCVHSNPEIHLYCPLDNLYNTENYVSMITDWHPMSEAPMPAVCNNRAPWPANGYAGVETWENGDLGQNSAPLFTITPITALPNYLDENPLTLAENLISNYDFVYNDGNVNMPMLAQTSSVDGVRYYRNCTVEEGYKVIINSVPEPDTGDCKDANGLYVDCNLCTIDGVPSQGASDPTLQEAIDRNGGNMSRYLIAAKKNGRNYLTSYYSEGGFYKDSCWYVFNRQGPMPSYVGPKPPYYGVTPYEYAAPGANVIRIWAEPTKDRPWSAVVYEKNPVIIAARTFTTTNTGSNHTCWLLARDLGLSLLYCRWCAPPVTILPAVPCCKDPEAVNYEENCGASDVDQTTIPTSQLVGSKVLAQNLPARMPITINQCMFMATSRSAAIRMQDTFVQSTSFGASALCLYGNYQISIAQLCKPQYLDPKAENPVPTKVPKGKTKDKFINPNVEDVYVMKDGTVFLQKDIKNKKTRSMVMPLAAGIIPGTKPLSKAFRPEDVQEERQSTKTILVIEANTVLSPISKLDATLKALSLLSSLKEVDCPVTNSQFAMTPCTEECNTVNPMSAVMYDANGAKTGPMEGMMNVDQGIMISTTKHTYQLDDMLKKMLKDIVPCMMYNLPFSLICRGGAVPEGMQFQDRPHADDTGSYEDEVQAPPPDISEEAAAENNGEIPAVYYYETSNDEPPVLYKDSTGTVYPPDYVISEYDIITEVPEGVFSVRCGKYKTRNEYTRAMAELLINFGYCDVWNQEIKWNCKNYKCANKFKAAAWETIDNTGNEVTVPEHTTHVRRPPVAAFDGEYIFPKGWEAHDPATIVRLAAEELACGMLHCLVGNDAIGLKCYNNPEFKNAALISELGDGYEKDFFVYDAKFYTREDVTQIAKTILMKEFECKASNQKTIAQPCEELCENPIVTIDIASTLKWDSSIPVATVLAQAGLDRELTVAFKEQNKEGSIVPEYTFNIPLRATYTEEIDELNSNGTYTLNIIHHTDPIDVRRVKYVAEKAQMEANRRLFCAPNKIPLQGVYTNEQQSVAQGQAAWVYFAYSCAIIPDDLKCNKKPTLITDPDSKDLQLYLPPS